eukprot:GFUD01074707.1.p1 GENE.GFUD01074707.1~~GFUD01074707.1.p1  ORF type:complete len:245 (-),score=59.70 GFUD01074707.1:19-669(-)
MNPSVFQRATGSGHPHSIRTQCERYVTWNLENMPMVKTMVSALKASGCAVDLSRNIQCEMCLAGKNIENAGGFDPALNQVFICANNADNKGLVHGALVRNLIQMFDACVNKYDFQNAEHLACSEIRKANLANCGYMVYMQQSFATVRWKKAHAACVRNTAIDYMIKTKFVKTEIAEKAVDKVFDKCYNDFEPIGRRPLNPADIERAHNEKFLFGYH